MNALVSIPWQPSYFLTPDTLTMLQLASAHAGHNIPVNDAWRSYAEQKGYWDAYQRYLHGGPYAAIASNPDTGQRNHMRGAAVDIQNRADRAAMLAVGFTPDPDEWWHFNNPRWASMPIIKTNTTTAGGNATPITPTPQEDYTMTQGSYFRLADTQTPLGAIVPGTILYQEQPGEPLLRVSPQEWEGAKTNHNTFLDMSTQNMQALINIVGVYDQDAKGRRTPAQAGRAARNGFSVYLP